MLEINDLNVNYGSRPVLKSISFDLLPGSVLAVLGPNGAGKTTLIRALSGIVPLTSGEVRVQGRSLNQLSALGNRLKLRTGFRDYKDSELENSSRRCL